MINLKTVLRTRLLACCLGLVIPVFANADDTEIYFARANAANEQNTPKANVLIMLDTSGSMRNCRTGTGSNWCSDIENRRITLLHEAMKQIIADAPNTVEIGLGRFRGSSGGRILLPVMPVNDLTRQYYLDALNSINEGQGDTDPSDRAQPSGGTPTSQAYDEMAKYMLGRSKSDGASYAGFGSICVSNAPDQEVCRDEVQWSDPVEVEECDVTQQGCTYTSAWNVVNYCDISDSSCRIDADGWQQLGRRESCDPRFANCEIRDCEGRGCRRNEERYFKTDFEQFFESYTLQESSVVQVCEVIEGACNDLRSIVGANDRYISPVNTANQCESNHIILFTDGAPSGDDPGNVEVVNCRYESHRVSWRPQLLRE